MYYISTSVQLKFDTALTDWRTKSHSYHNYYLFI